MWAQLIKTRLKPGREGELETLYAQLRAAEQPGSGLVRSTAMHDQSDHLSASYSKNVAQIILNKLAPNDQHAIFCYPQAPLTGSTSL